MEKILIVDDEKSLLDLLAVVFKKEGYSVKTAISGPKAREILEKDDIDLVITDIKMPQMSGMEVLKFVKDKNAEIPVIMITAYGSVKQAVDALKAGALDYVVKPFDVEELKILVSRGLEKRRLKEENILLKRDLKDKYSFEKMIGKSRVMREIYTLIEKIATTDSTVLVTGESGTGKEMAARAVHARVAAAKVRSSPSIAPPCPRTFWRANSSVTSRDRSPAPSPIKRACSKRPDGGPFFSTRSGKCLPGPRSSFSGPSRSARSAGWEGTRKSP